MTNQLFREVLEGQIPLARKRTGGRTRIIFIPAGSFNPTAPTVADLEAGFDISDYISHDGYSPDPWPHMAPGKGWDEPAKYVMPPPPYPIGNIATQKRRRKL